MKRLRSAKVNVSKLKSPSPGKTQNSPQKKKLKHNDDLKIVKQNKSNYYFSSRQTRSLIEAVKVRPMLWKKNQVFGPQQAEVWQKITEELNLQDYGFTAVRKKWISLRKAFLKYSQKLATPALGHCESMRYQVKWSFFENMSFLYDENEDEDEEQPGEISYIKMEPKVEILGSPAPQIQNSQQDEPQSTHVSNPSIKTIIPMDFIAEDNQSNNLLLPMHEAHSSNISTFASSRRNGVDINTSNPHMPSQQCQETNRTFCNYLSTELRLLSELRSRHLRSLLMRKLHEFMDLQKEN